MCPGLQTETLWMWDELFLLPPSLLLLSCALLAGEQAQLLGGSKPTGRSTGGQQATIPPQEQHMCGSGRHQGTAIPELGGVCDIALMFTSGDLFWQEEIMGARMCLFSRHSQA